MNKPQRAQRGDFMILLRLCGGEVYYYYETVNNYLIFNFFSVFSVVNS